MVEPADTFLIKIEVQKQPQPDCVEFILFATLYVVSLSLAIMYKYLTRPYKQQIALRFEESANEEVQTIYSLKPRTIPHTEKEDDAQQGTA
jgi:hypothetical protein